MPSHYEERLQKDLAAIQQLVAAIGTAIGKALEDSVKAVLSLDRELAAATVVGDYAINRQTRDLDRLCHGFVARHLPSAGHLRFVSSVLRLGIGLERVGDYATTISRTAAQLSTAPPPVVARDIETMGEHARRTLKDAMRSFNGKDAALAQATLTSAAQFAQFFDKVFADLIAEGDAHSRPSNDLFSLMATFNRLDRVIHQAKNICEETIFVATGKTKGEKVFHLLFVDGRNDGQSLLAEHYTRKAFPQSGRYRSAGWDAADEIDPTYVKFAASVGIDLAKEWPTSLTTLRDQIDEFQFVIGLGPGSRAGIGKVPFHTTVLQWDLGPNLGPDEVFRQLTPRIRDLMERLRGDQAN